MADSLCFASDRSYDISDVESATSDAGDNASQVFERFMTPHDAMWLRVPPDTDFVKRPALTDQICTKLSAPASRVALVGPGGVGKTQLAIDFVRKTQRESPQTWVLWIHASNAVCFDQSIRDVADKLGIYKEKDPKANPLHVFRDWLRDERTGSWVIVLDDADHSDFLLEPLTAYETGESALLPLDCIAVCDHGSIIVTSRSKRGALNVVSGSQVIDVLPMSEEEAEQMLKTTLILPSPAAAKQLVRALSCLPSAIAQAAAYICYRKPPISVRQYLKKFRIKRNQFQEDDRFDDKIDKAILLTWQISFEHIYLTETSAAELLLLLSFCYYLSTPEKLLRTHGKNANIYTDTIDFEEHMITLSRFSFVTFDRSTNGWQTHKAVQHAAQVWLRECDRFDEVYAQFVNRMFGMLHGHNLDCHLFRMLLPHIMCISEQRPASTHAGTEWQSVMCKAVEFAFEQGDYINVYLIAVSSSRASSELLGEKDKLTRRMKTIIAKLFSAQGRWDEAENMFQAAKETSLVRLKADLRSTLSAISRLAARCTNSRRWKKAEQLEGKDNAKKGHFNDFLAMGPRNQHEKTTQMPVDAGTELYAQGGQHGEAHSLLAETEISTFQVPAHQTGEKMVSSGEAASLSYHIVDTSSRPSVPAEDTFDTTSVRTDGLVHNLDRDTLSALTSEFVEQLVDELEPEHMKEFLKDSNAVNIEDLLRDYAALLRISADTSAEDKAAISIRHQRKVIVTALKESAEAWKPDTKDQPTWSERVSNWHILLPDEGPGTESVTPPLSELHLSTSHSPNRVPRPLCSSFQDTTNDKMSEHIEPEQQEDTTTHYAASRLARRVFSSDDVPLPKDLPAARKFLLTGNEFVWLRNGLRNMISCSQTGRIQSQIRSQLAEFINKLPRGRPLILSLDWDPVSFMKEQYTFAIDISKVLVFCGSAQTTFCATVGEYIHMLWPNVDASLMKCLQALLDDSASDGGTSPAGVHARMVEQFIKITISDKATNIDMLEISEACVWLSVACRAASNENCVEYCTPQLSSSDNSEGDLVIDVTTITTPLHQDLATANGTCWFGMVRNPVIARWYPVRAREASIPLEGLELSFDVMVALSHVDWATSFNRTFVMKGFLSALTPALRCHGLIVWHLFVQFEGRMSYLDACPGPVNSDLMHLDLDQVATQRHIVGFWTKDAQVAAGTNDPDLYKFDLSNSREANDYTCTMGSLNITGGKYLTAGGSLVIAKKDNRVVLENAHARWSETILAHSMNMSVLFYGSLDRRAWLLDGTSTLLHLIRGWMTSEMAKEMRRDALEEFQYARGRGGREECFAALVANKAKKLFETHESSVEKTQSQEWSKTSHAGASDSGYSSLPNAQKYRMETKVTTSEVNVKHLGMEIWRCLEKMRDQLQQQKYHPPEIQIRLPRVQNDYLTGWDARDVIRERGAITPRTVHLKPEGKNWSRMVRESCIPVLLARSFGDLIKPRDESSCCQQTSRMPKDCDYMAVPSYILSKMAERWLYDDAGNNLRGCIQIHDHWYCSGLTALPEKCKQRSGSHCNCCVISHFGPKPIKGRFDLSERVPVSNVLDQFAHGATIIGGSRRIRKLRGQTEICRDLQANASTTATDASKSTSAMHTDLGDSSQADPVHASQSNPHDGPQEPTFYTPRSNRKPVWSSRLRDLYHPIK